MLLTQAALDRLPVDGKWIDVRRATRRPVADHQESRTIGRIYHPIFFKSGFLIGTDSAAIGWIRIRDDPWMAFQQQIGGEAANESRAMAAFDHIWRADEQIDAART